MGLNNMFDPMLDKLIKPGVKITHLAQERGLKEDLGAGDSQWFSSNSMGLIASVGSSLSKNWRESSDM
jgi:hypothetical protein